MDMLNIKLMGSFSINHGKEELLSKLSSKSAAIIAILICNDNNKMARDKLSSTLWADSFETSNYNLRYNLWNIKKVIPSDESGNEFIVSTKEYCFINPKYIFECDLKVLEDIDAQEIDKENPKTIDKLIYAREHIKGDFLDQFYIKDSDDFNEWVLFQRARYQKKYIQSLNSLLDYYTNEGIYEKAIEILEDILRVNPYEEEASFRLMKLHIEKNERHLAIIQYRKCYNTLRQELNISPQKKIRDLYMTLVDSEAESDKTRKENVVIRINEYADPGCEYILMSELSERLLEISKRNQIGGACKRYWMDISEIQPRVLDYIEMDYKITTIKDIRLYNSLKNILSYLSNEKNIQILVANHEKIDCKSRQFLGIVENSNVASVQYLEYSNVIV
ncbi:BTAD domain-containing putative transcriptional regulator [Proteocatella sphenisci]|uniref:BTAD domain-containing putative transcriptional regulator n=1 Tax=Proteocatella sphenisci TaxID=181070 RepID=UPI0004903B3A|nr:BTAD domain-containing putative transcriptional regulator [Proteocatella sphenisci]